MDLLCIGDVMVDVRVEAGAPLPGDLHGDVLIQPGGTSANAAVWAAWDGANARVHGAVGTDLTGRLLEEALRVRGVKMHLTPYPDTSTGTVLVVHQPGGRSMVTHRGANARLRAVDLPGMLVCGAVLVSGYLLLHEDTALALGERYPVAAVKLGAAGAVVVADGRVHRVHAEAVREVDPTGAGDAFDGVLLGALARNVEMAEALRRACHAGAIVAASTRSWPGDDPR